jgi:hypothetical protein
LVIAVIAILISILMPPLSRAKFNAKKLVCGSGPVRQMTIEYDIWINLKENWGPYEDDKVPLAFG